jgi:8-amino-7-oxononanoate synthase
MRIVMDTLESFAHGKLADLAARDLRRQPPVTTPHAGMRVVREGRRLVSFSSNDYLDLGAHPAVRAAAIAAVERYGTGTGASYLVTGRNALHAQLEEQLADFAQTEAACVFASGYLANVGVVGALAGEADLVLIDELAHASLWAGAQSSGARVLPYCHNDVAQLTALLAQERARHRQVLVLTEGVFSMDGDLAPLSALADAARAYDAWLLCDDAHGLGVVGGGRGALFAHARRPAVPLQIGTLSKALASIGGYLCASRAVVELMKNRARTLIYATALPPASAAAALTALGLIARGEAPLGRPLALARRFAARLDLPAPASAIVPIVVGDARRALDLQARLEDDGFLVVAIRPPSVPPEGARLRVTFSAAHKECDVDALADALQRVTV